MPFSAERLVLNFLQVFLQDLQVAGLELGLAASEEGVVQARFERLGTPGDRGQRIVDFVGHARGQEADAGEAACGPDDSSGWRCLTCASRSLRIC